MVKAVHKAAAYVLVHAPDMIVTHGTTITTERDKNPDSAFVKEVFDHVPTFLEAVAYPPNQCYIGNITPAELKEIPLPWYENRIENASRSGKIGEMMPLDEFIGMLKISDAFGLVMVEEVFLAKIRDRLKNHPLINEKDLAVLAKGDKILDIRQRVDAGTADPIMCNQELVGCIKRAHDVDPNLNAHVMFENTVAKASGILALRTLLVKNDIDPKDIDYIIETSEEACGDMNQRGGGNFAKAIGEGCGCVNATGSDTRAFCAAPAHGIITATALVNSKIYKNVVVVAGGATAKLGMNAKDHVKKGLPVLEDVLGGFAVLISADDGVSPYIRTDAIGRHTIGSGSAPQAVTSAIVTDPLDRVGLSVKDIDKYSVEMQNPEVTKPAGAGDVPLANYKMIAALGVKRGDIERTELNNFVETHGMVGWAPTQGHIPSGVPYMGFARQAIMEGDIQRAMIIGKGSLFLARMTNLFDGVSFIMERNPGRTEDVGTGVDKEDIRQMLAEAIRALGDSLIST